MAENRNRLRVEFTPDPEQVSYAMVDMEKPEHRFGEALETIAMELLDSVLHQGGILTIHVSPPYRRATLLVTGTVDCDVRVKIEREGA